MQKMIEGFQLSPQQKRLWLLQQESPAFCAQCAILIDGPLDHDRLQQALQRIISRHEILRTTFHRRPGIKIPIQVVSESILPSWREVMSDVNCPQRDWDIEEVMRQERCLPRDFESGPRPGRILLEDQRDIAAQEPLAFGPGQLGRFELGGEAQKKSDLIRAEAVEAEYVSSLQIDGHGFGSAWLFRRINNDLREAMTALIHVKGGRRARRSREPNDR